MPPAVSRISQSRLDRALDDISRHISDRQHWQDAMRQLSAIKDFSMGETQLCSAAAAMENCEQIKGYFPDAAPGEAVKNLDEIIAEIRHLQEEQAPDFLGLLGHPLVIAALATAVLYFVLFR